jgi:carbonic anhydrase
MNDFTNFIFFTWTCNKCGKKQGDYKSSKLNGGQKRDRVCFSCNDPRVSYPIHIRAKSN